MAISKNICSTTLYLLARINVDSFEIWIEFPREQCSIQRFGIVYICWEKAHYLLIWYPCFGILRKVHQLARLHSAFPRDNLETKLVPQAARVIYYRAILELFVLGKIRSIRLQIYMRKKIFTITDFLLLFHRIVYKLENPVICLYVSKCNNS